MPIIQRSALVEHSAARMFALVNDLDAYPARFDWCDDAKVLERGEDRVVARLDLGLGALRTWFTTENTLSPPHHIDMTLVDGPFKSLTGRWSFHALDESACKVTLKLEFEPSVRLLGPALALGFQSLADRMVDDFVRVADSTDCEPQGMRITLIRAWPGHHEELVLNLPEPATVAAALSAAGWEAGAVAIFGVRASGNEVLHPGDRIELLRPLVADPKQARRARAKAGLGGAK